MDVIKPDKEIPTHIVGIGASAGGLEAIQDFFKNMPVDTGLSFIVIQHLSPDYKSLMVELLSKKTNIPVKQADDGMTVERDTIYLIPPKKSLTLSQGKILLKKLEPTGGINLPIDEFFRSLAQEAGEQAIAVVLSGTGSDGTRGVRAVKEYNGMVMVQDEESAQFDGMPKAAVSTGLADFVLPPHEMVDQLLAFVKHPFASRKNSLQSLAEDEDAMSRIFSELKKKTTVDFSFYKKNTILRRLERRIAINDTSDIDEYLEYLYSNPGEVTTLYKELLIGVTSFFRDKEAMNEIMKVYLPDLLQKTTSRELRFWVAGCSTGEEAYTIAIMAKEAMEHLGISRDIKIFATDIDKNAIQKAGNGIFPESIAADLDLKLLGKYFYKKESSYQIVRNIREMIVFAHQNMIKDPPFTNIDLISCRNLLIYLQPVLQKKALDLFDFSLNKYGLLILGASETVGEMIEQFVPVNHKYKIYRSTGSSGKLIPGGLSYADSRMGNTESYRRDKVLKGDDNKMLNRYIQILTDQYFVLSVIVNSSLEILHTFGETKGIFRIPEGPPKFEIPRMAVKELAIPLSTGIQKVFRNRTPITYGNIKLSGTNEERQLHLRIAPLPESRGKESLVAVFFEEVENKESSVVDLDNRGFNIQDDTMQRIMDLEADLQFSRENLQATIEELETSNEELQATNEELLASNEELQSTNEELQSTNEELYTVNSESQKRITELTELNNDVENLLTNSHIGELILDHNLEIRKYSPETARIFSIIEQDIGRPLSHLSHRIRDFNLIKTIKEVMKTEKPFEKALSLNDDSIYLVRIIPYQTGPKTFSGAVLTFVDITDLESVNRQLENSIKTNLDIMESITSGLFIFRMNDRKDMILDSLNYEAEKIIGPRKKDIIGKTFDEILPAASSLGLTEKFKAVLHGGGSHYRAIESYEDEFIKGTYRIQAFPLPDSHLAISFEDLSDLSNIKNQLEEETGRYHYLFNEMNLGVVYQDREGKIVNANPAAEKVLGLSLSQMQGRTSMDKRWKALKTDGSLLPGEEHPAMVCLRSGKPVNDYVMCIFNPMVEEERWILVNAKPLFKKNEKTPYQVFTTFEDITEKKKQSDQTREAAERLEFAFSSARVAWWEYNIATSKVIASPQKGSMLDYQNLDTVQDVSFWTGLIHPDDYDQAMNAMRAHVEGKTEEYDIVYRLRSKTGRYVKLIDRGKVVTWDEKGIPLKVMGAVMLAQL
jgi:two-component system CheB/CheR fusion protein